MSCIFCKKISNHHILLESRNFKVIYDISPIQSGHLLILAKEHLMDIREVSNEMMVELLDLQKKLITMFDTYFSVDGVSLIQNNGKIMDEGTHFHIHVIPRYEEDEFWDHQIVKERHIKINELTRRLKSLGE